MNWGTDRAPRSLPTGPVRIFGETFGPLPFGSTPSLPIPRGSPICPPSLSCSSVSRRVIAALVAFAQGDLVRTCRASCSVHCEAGLLSQTESAAMRQVNVATSVCTRNARICHSESVEQRPNFLARGCAVLELYHHSEIHLGLATAKVREKDTTDSAST